MMDESQVKEIVKQYIKDNLSVEVEIFFGDIIVKVFLGTEEISRSSNQIA